jgi:hypothetical protein
MTTFNSSMLPATVNTLERLAYWVGTAKSICDGNSAAVEVDGLGPELASQVSQIQRPNGRPSYIFRLRIDFDPAIFSDKSKKPWEHMLETTGGDNVPAAHRVA